MCAPHECTTDVILGQVFPQIQAEKLFGREGAESFSGTVLSDVLRVEEMLNWPSLELDFAIAGLDNCGTTSLHRNLDQHPEIAFSTSQEDFFFLSDVVHRLVPFKTQVEEFNRRMAIAKDRKWEESRAVGKNKSSSSGASRSFP